MSIKIQDKGANELLKSLTKKLRSKVGVIGSDAVQAHRKAAGLTVVDIATIHEFGLGVPRRSFIRDYVDQNQPTLKKHLRNVGARILSGGEPKLTLQAFGTTVEGEIKDRISDHIPPALAAATIRRKGSDTPLIDTNQLRSSILSAEEVL